MLFLYAIENDSFYFILTSQLKNEVYEVVLCGTGRSKRKRKSPRTANIATNRKN